MTGLTTYKCKCCGGMVKTEKSNAGVCTKLVTRTPCKSKGK